MSLSWKFWKRNRTMPPALPAAPVQQAPDTWLPLSSSKELLGLQRIIGNQAVLELLASRHQSFWRKLRRN